MASVDLDTKILGITHANLAFLKFFCYTKFGYKIIKNKHFNYLNWSIYGTSHLSALLRGFNHYVIFPFYRALRKMGYGVADFGISRYRVSCGVVLVILAGTPHRAI